MPGSERKLASGQVQKRAGRSNIDEYQHDKDDDDDFDGDGDNDNDDDADEVAVDNIISTGECQIVLKDINGIWNYFINIFDCFQLNNCRRQDRTEENRTSQDTDGVIDSVQTYIF